MRSLVAARASAFAALAFVFTACADPTRPLAPGAEPGSTLSPTLALTGGTGTAGTITSRLNAGKCVTVGGGSVVNGAAVVLSSCNAGPTQQFTWQPNGEIRTGNLCLDASGGRGQDGDDIIVSPCDGGTSQKWTATTAGEIKGINGKCLDVYASRTADGSRLVIWRCHGGTNQRWANVTVSVPAPTPTPTPPPDTTAPPAPTGGATIASRHAPALCLDAASVSGAWVTVSACASSPSQQLALQANGEIRTGGGLCLDAYGGSGNDGDRLAVWACNGGPNQKWTATAAGEIKGIKGKCVDIYGASKQAGARIVIWSCHGGTNQKWHVSVGGGAPTPTPTPVPTPTPPPPAGPRPGFYVAPNGSSGGDGSVSRPWDLATALAKPGAVQPGDTIWMRGGTYRGNVTSRLAGSPGRPIVLRQFPGERATIDGTLMVLSPWAEYWSFEVMNSNRTSASKGGIEVSGANTKFINLVVHDNNGGFGFWDGAVDAEIYGTLIYNNGVQGSDRGHGHGIYMQNRTGTKRIVDNIIFNQFGYGIHAYGSATAGLTGFHVEGNAAFTNGSVSTRANPDILIGGQGPAARVTVTRNFTFQQQANPTVRFGYDAVNQDLVVTNNYFVGKTQVIDWRNATFTGNTITTGTWQGSGQTALQVRLPSGTSYSAYTWQSNRYTIPAAAARPFEPMTGPNSQFVSFAAWRQMSGLDGNSSYTAGSPTGTDVFVRPNRYEAGRANIIVYNWAGAGSVAVDVSSVLRPGDRYEVRHATDYFGAPVASGTYGGGALNLSTAGRTPVRVLTGSPSAPAGLGPVFNVYVLVKAGA